VKLGPQLSTFTNIAGSVLIHLKKKKEGRGLTPSQFKVNLLRLFTI
jgi:hypothetical protein